MARSSGRDEDWEPSGGLDAESPMLPLCNARDRSCYNSRSISR
jgi:hypothetical protein